jgi:hypothetical protein
LLGKNGKNNANSKRNVRRKLRKKIEITNFKEKTLFLMRKKLIFKNNSRLNTQTISMSNLFENFNELFLKSFYKPYPGFSRI